VSQLDNTCLTVSRGDVWAYKTSLTPPLLIDVPVPSQEREQSSRGITFASVSSIFLFFFIRFWNCFGVVLFVFHFISELFIAINQLTQHSSFIIEHQRIMHS